MRLDIIYKIRSFLKIIDQILNIKLQKLDYILDIKLDKRIDVF